MSSAAAERLSTDGADWKVLERRSVVLYGPMEGRTYFRDDFLKGLEAVFAGSVKDNVLSFGPLSKNNEWYLCCKSDAAKDRLLAAGQIPVKSYLFRIRSADRAQFKVRVHWAPPFLANDVITHYLSQFGKVHAITFEKSVSKGFEGVATGVRTVVMSGNRDKIPHIIPLSMSNEKSELLVTMTGRQPLCLRCRQEGHFRRECNTPFCRHCRQYGHMTEQCAAAGSYASALRETGTRAEIAQCELVNIEEEMEQGMEGEGVVEGAGAEIGVEGEKAVQVESGVKTPTEMEAGKKVGYVAKMEKRVTTAIEAMSKDEKNVWVETAKSIQRIDADRKAEVARKVEADKVRGEVKGESGDRVTIVPESQQLQASSADIFSESSSEEVSSDDEGRQWTEVCAKKRKRSSRARSVSPPPPSISPSLGQLVVAEVDTESESESGISKKKCAEERGEEV